jgi:DnaJ homolog subfamily A member 2
MMGMFGHPARVTCFDCHGSGSALRIKDRCKKCKGERVIEEKKHLEFWIERGAEQGDRIVLKREADQEPGKETGDAVFVIVEKVHPVFSRMGPDLRATLRITLQEALCGFSRVIFTTLDGRGLSYTHKVTQGQVIRPKDFFKIAGEGMPLGKKSDAKGDLYFDVDIEFPADGWITDPTQMVTLRSLLSTPSIGQTNGTATNDVPEIVDDVTFETADPEDWEEAQSWEEESDGESDGVPDCATQ